MEILGHRGARGEAPENTLSGFRHLRNLGIRAVEFDIQVAGDGQLVVIHDDTVDRTTGGHGHLHDFTSDTLFSLDACHSRTYPVNGLPDQSWPQSEGIPRLTQVLEVIHDFTHVQLEVKSRLDADIAKVVEMLPALWRPFGERALATSFNQRFLEQLRTQHPEIPRGLLVETDFTEDPVAVALQLGCCSLGPHFSLCSPALVQRAHDAGLKVSVWTVNEPEEMLRLRSMGVDSIITDFPALALDVLA